jgi:SARP family transcriptional regulator, regulator of embCAB operon
VGRTGCRVETAERGESVERQRLRLHLTGRVGVEGTHWVDQEALGGRQGRLAFVRLVMERHRPLPIDTLADALWGDALPRSWEASLRAVVSKLRSVLASVDPGSSVRSDAGCYQLAVGDAWVDVEAAANAVDRGEGALRHGDLRTAWSEATVAAGIARRPVLPGVDVPWVDALRAHVRSCSVRALDVLVEVELAGDQRPLALSHARELVAMEPLREAGHRALMRAHQAAGERGEALRVHAELRAVLAEELGIEPSPETEALYLDLLRAPSTARPPRTTA